MEKNQHRTDEPRRTDREVGGGDDRVARRAYELYEQRGREDGRDVDDWLEAERELRNKGRR